MVVVVVVAIKTEHYSILGYNIGSLAASGSTVLVLRQFCVGAGVYRILVRSFLW